MSEHYLTTAEVARRLRLKTKSLRNKVTAGVFREGEHFFRRRGLGPRWCWDRVVAWLEGDGGGKGARGGRPTRRARRAAGGSTGVKVVRCRTSDRTV
jgi:hypothetical protein